MDTPVLTAGIHQPVLYLCYIPLSLKKWTLKMESGSVVIEFPHPQNESSLWYASFSV